ncbi:MAG: type II secretion system protein [Planctomycetes bacterium]|nr:type II secretion system protein [Planctomycetota bacterium]
MAPNSIALRSTKPFPHRRHAFSFIELLVVISILAILASLLPGVLRSSVISAERISCSSRISSINILMELYISDHSDMYPAVSRYMGDYRKKVIWDTALYNLYIDGSMDENQETFQCPANDITMKNNTNPTYGRRGYAMNYGSHGYIKGKMTYRGVGKAGDGIRKALSDSYQAANDPKNIGVSRMVQTQQVEIPLPGRQIILVDFPHHDNRVFSSWMGDMDFTSDLAASHHNYSTKNFNYDIHGFPESYNMLMADGSVNYLHFLEARGEKTYGNHFGQGMFSWHSKDNPSPLE